jgi:hypothetical protein
MEIGESGLSGFAAGMGEAFWAYPSTVKGDELWLGSVPLRVVLVLGRVSALSGARFGTVTWLILPVVICLSQRLSHACLSINKFVL